MPTLKKDIKLAAGFLRTDQYQLTMAQMYYRLDYHEQIVQFDHFFSSVPGLRFASGGVLYQLSCFNQFPALVGLDQLQRFSRASCLHAKKNIIRTT
ncbi:MAG: hypothetical protein R6V56_08075 [Lentisphaeria bacterium]